MRYKHKKLILVILFFIGLVLFFHFGFNTTKSGPSYTQNCTDIANQYDPCELHNVQYGIPFIYAQGHPYIPGNSYSRENVEPLPLLGNLAVWILPLPIIYLLITKKRD